MDAYEIRLELLKLAQSIESDRIWSDRNRLEQDWNAQRDKALTDGTTVPSFPKLPGVTHNDVISVAEQLNRFVSHKG